MFGGGRRSSKTKNKGTTTTTTSSNPGGGRDGSKAKLIPNLETDDEHKHFFYSRVLSRETNNHHPSFRVYYGDVSVAVPFTWESQPGTPKSKFHVDSGHITYNAPLPPLTPPPSYFSNYSSSSATPASKKQYSRWPTKLFMSFRKRHTNSHSVGSSDNSTSLSPTRRDHRHHNSDNLLHSRRRVSSLESLLDLKLEASDPDDNVAAGSSAEIIDGTSGSGSGSSPTSTLCFRGSTRLRGRYGWL